MRRNMHITIVGIALSLSIVGCGITSNKLSDNKKDSEDANGVNADASVNNQQFSLSLPYLPDIKPNSAAKAHIRIFKSHVALPSANVDCAESPREERTPSALSLTTEPAKIVYQDSMVFKVGASIGPILLDPGLFTAVLDIYDKKGKRYTGTSWFDVKQNSISNIEMKMIYVNDCSGGHNSGVVITPIVPGQPDHMISACEFATMEIALCSPQEAVCYYKDYKAHSSCGLSQARQKLIGNLCQKNIKVSTNFKNEITCDVSDVPPPKPQPDIPEPKPPVSKPRACLQLEMKCDASDQLKGQGCYASYKSFASSSETKTSISKSGYYCKDRYATLKELCDAGADSYKIQCIK